MKKKLDLKYVKILTQETHSQIISKSLIEAYIPKSFFKPDCYIVGNKNFNNLMGRYLYELNIPLIKIFKDDFY
ncbi:hypothetical protein IGI95_002673 [Enterococcus sp. DIV0784]